MSNLIFTWDNDLSGNSGTHQFNTLSSSFGDGYEQNVSVGINNRKGTWPITKTAKKEVIQSIKQFLDSHKGADSFLWESPLDGQVRVKAGEYQIVYRGSGLYRLTTTFTQVFYP
ncbi:phage tail protein [Acinetobacter sp. NigerLNRRAM0016]